MMLAIAWNPLRFRLLDTLPKGGTLMPSTAMIIFSWHCFCSACRSTGANLLFTQTMPDPTQSNFLKAIKK
jgi:hypothetical protein